MNAEKAGKSEKATEKEIPVSETDLVAEIKKTKRKQPNLPETTKSAEIIDTSEVVPSTNQNAGKRKKEKLEEIAMKAPEELSLTSAVKRKRNKK